MFLSPGSRARPRPYRAAQPKTIIKAYAVVAQDYGQELVLGGGILFTVTLGPPGNYQPGFSVTLTNQDGSRGKLISPSGATAFILWPLQTVTMYNTNTGSWAASPAHQPWMPETAPTFNVDPTGSNSSDGLGTGTGAFQTLAFAAVNAYQNVYTRNVGSVTIDGGGNTFQEQVAVFYPMNGGGTLIFQNMSWKPITSGFCLEHGDGALVGVTNTTFLTTGVTTPAGIFIAHNDGILDVNTSVTFSLTVGLSGSLFDHDAGGGGGSQINVNNGFTIGGGAANTGFIFRAQQPLMRYNVNGAIFFNNTTWGRFLWSSQASSIIFQGNVTFNSSGGGISTSVGLINQNGTVQNLSGATLPGGSITPTTGGQFNTTTTA